MNSIKLLPILLTILLVFPVTQADAQLGRRLLNGQGERELKMYECGYVYEPKLKDRLNPMGAVQSAMGNAMTTEGATDLNNIAISVFYQAHLHPQEILRFPTETPGWATCGDAVYLGMTNRSGMGMADTDGKVTIDGKEIPSAGMGTYFDGFSSDHRGEKSVSITSSDGDQIAISVSPATPLEITSVDGKAKGESITIDGSKDITIEIANGDADPESFLHVSLVSKLVGTPILYDIYVVKARNSITIPKEAFYNYEGSPSPFMKENTLIVNRVSETVLEGTDAGAIRTLSCYMDWLPVMMEGDIAKGSIMTAGFDTTKNTQVQLNLTTEGQYDFSLRKGSPFNSPPIDRMDKVAVASFVVRGNLEAEEVSYSTTSTGTWKTTTTKWFPELSEESWQALADRLYADFEKQLTQELGVEVLPLESVVNSNAYAYTKPIEDEVTKTYVEVGAGGTERILTTSTTDLFEDLSISFASDFVGARLAQELGVDAVVAVTIDLTLQMESEGLDPRVSIAFIAPNVSHKAKASYFSATAVTEARSLNEAASYSGGATNQLYQMIKGDALISEMFEAIDQLQQAENTHPAYRILWEGR